jgi:uncharacterized membrane protein (UPF0182 family)
VRVRAQMRDGVPTPELSMSNPFGARAQSHLSVLLGLILIVFGVQRLLSRYGYSFSDNDELFTGIGYTDEHARITASLVVAIIAFVCAVVFFVNAALRLWKLSVAAIILMVVSGLIISTVYPLIVQRFTVTPSQMQEERPYITNHITATQQAFGINDVQIEEYSATTETAPGQLRADAEALPGIRLWDPAVIRQTFEQLQQVRGYYVFPSVLDVDRYTIDGQFTDAIVAAREIDNTKIPESNWINNHTVYTHGYAMVAAYGNRKEAISGEPQWIVGDIPPVGAL